MIGSWQSITLICLICIFLSYKKGIWISAHVVIVLILSQLAKSLVARPRPSKIGLIVEHGYSFPSGHSMISFLLFGMIAYFLWNRNKLLSILIMILPMFIGISRIYLGVHYTTDVLAGFLFSFAYLCTVIQLIPHHKISLLS